MKIKFVYNGKVIEKELTPEEIALMEAEAARQAEEMKNQPPTAEERLEALESAMLAMLGGGL